MILEGRQLAQDGQDSTYLGGPMDRFERWLNEVAVPLIREGSPSAEEVAVLRRAYSEAPELDEDGLAEWLTAYFTRAVQHAVQLLTNDFRETIGRPPNLGVVVGEGGTVRVTMDGEPSMDDGGGIFSYGEREIVVEVAIQAQSMFVQAEQKMWPLCDAHRVPGRAGLVNGKPCWTCSDHLMGEIGKLRGTPASSNSTD